MTLEHQDFSTSLIFHNLYIVFRVKAVSWALERLSRKNYTCAGRPPAYFVKSLSSENKSCAVGDH
jgi:hypothetical protein